MPIAFPPQDRGPEWIWAVNVVQQPMQAPGVSAVDLTNLGNVGQPFDAASLDPGIPYGWQVTRAVNLRNLGFDYEGVEWDDRFNPAANNGIPTAAEDGILVAQTDWAASNRAIAGITRDDTGAILGNCAVKLFVTGADAEAYETTSDASGNFSFSNPGTGPFYIVAYKPGSPDVAGTTVNTLMPTAV